MSQSAPAQVPAPWQSLASHGKKTNGDRDREAVKREEFLAQLAELEPSRHVSVAVAGVDERDD